MANRRDYNVTLKGDSNTWNYVTGWNTLSITASTASRGATNYGRSKPTTRWVPPTAYSMSETSTRYARGSVSQFDSSLGRYTNRADGIISISSSFIGDPVSLGVDETHPAELANRALIKARTNLKAQTINLAQGFGERKQTAGLVADNLTRIAKAFLALKKGRLKDTFRYLKADPIKIVAKNVPQAWLELQYGWKPLLSDIHGAVTELDNRDRGDFRVTVKGSAIRNIDKVGDFGTNGNYSSRTCRVKGWKGSFVRIDAIPGNAALQKASALGLTNPLSLAWELLPYSFVVDWAYPLGPYFNQMDALVGWDIIGFSQSNFIKLFEKWTLRPGSSGTITTYGNWVATKRLVKLDRSAGTSVPFPVLPSIKDPFSGLHVANALALLAGAFSGSSHVK